MPFDDRLLLTTIQKSISDVKSHIGSMTGAEFAADGKTVDAVVRRLQIISEASRGLTDDLKARHPEIDWVAMRDAGNFYRHAYWQVTEARVWDTAVNHLDSLNTVVLAELARLDT